MSAAVGRDNLPRNAEAYKVVRHHGRLIVASAFVSAYNQPFELAFAVQIGGCLDSCFVEEVWTVVQSACRVCAKQKGCVLRRNVVGIVERSSAGVGVYDDVANAYQDGKQKR